LVHPIPFLHPASHLFLWQQRQTTQGQGRSRWQQDRRRRQWFSSLVRMYSLLHSMPLPSPLLLSISGSTDAAGVRSNWFPSRT
jgi:hypothetical protein